MSSKRKAPAPTRQEESRNKINLPTEEPDANKRTPKFCLKHTQSGYDVSRLTAEQKADFAMALHKRAKMTWTEIILAHKHGLGSENLPANSIKPSVPSQLEGTETFMVLRYSGKLPMVGFRSLDTFHIIWIEQAFGDLYNHD
jgi:hypothetical protein